MGFQWHSFVLSYIYDLSLSFSFPLSLIRSLSLSLLFFFSFFYLFLPSQSPSRYFTRRRNDRLSLRFLLENYSSLRVLPPSKDDLSVCRVNRINRNVDPGKTKKKRSAFRLLAVTLPCHPEHAFQEHFLIRFD